MLGNFYCILLAGIWLPLSQLYAENVLDCKVVIIGGGVGGIHTAYQLSKLPPSDNSTNVCLFEKEPRLGGRVHDVVHDTNTPDLVYGLGALRVLEGQEQIFALAKELGVKLMRTPYESDLINTRGQFAFSSDQINLLAFPTLSKASIDESGYGTEGAFFSLLLENRSSAKHFFDVRGFTRNVVTPEGFQFLHDVTRLRSEFIRPVDIDAFFAYYLEEARQGSVPSYPVGGMSQFINKMAERAVLNGAQIYRAEPVLRIDKQAGKPAYQIITEQRIVYAEYVVIATEATALRHIKGPITEAITKTAQFQDIMPIEVVVINQQWPQTWWIDSGYGDKIINRAWTTEHCLNFIEIPLDEYSAQQQVTRSVYSDDPACNEFWKTTYAQGGIQAVETEIYRGLKHLFPQANIPNPQNTIFQLWPSAWHWLRAGTDFLVEDIVSWAVSPLPNEQISLVGESYFISRAGWIDGAVRSSQKFLQHYLQ